MRRILSSEISKNLDVRQWKGEITDRRFKRSFVKHNPSLVGCIEDTDVYMYKEIKGGGYHYHFASFEDNSLSNADYTPITFYCHIGYNSSRNGLFKAGSGMHTALIWRNKEANLPHNFAMKVMNQIVLKRFVTKMFLSDKIKSPDGGKLFKHLLHVLSMRGWCLYIGLSDGKHKYVIPVSYEQYLAKIQSIQGLGKGYRYRCVFALLDDDLLDSVIDEDVLVVRFSRARRLGLFTDPVEFEDLDEVDKMELRDYLD